MKKKLVFSAMLVCLVALGLAFIGCSGDEPDPKTIKITGIVSPANTKANAQVDVNDGDNNKPGGGAVAMGWSDIVNQTLSVDLYNWADGKGGEKPWTGDGKWYIRLKFRSSIDNHQIDYSWKNGQKYDIKDAVTELNFADFVLVWEEGK
jgi:hypothetical protein